MLKGGVSMVVEEYDIDPVLQAYEPGRLFLGLFIWMINKIGGIGLKYYDDVLIKDVLLLFLTPSSLLPHTTGKPGKKVREEGLDVQST